MTPRKPTIYGPDGHPIVRARDRHAPKSRKHVGLEGWVSWGLIDRSGHVAKGGEQHNLILNTFLDRIAAADLANYTGFLSHFAVGTGSTEPDVTDTALDNELARTTTLISNSLTRPGNGVYEIVIEREFDFGAANGNLTEFGFAGGASSDMLVRELFRDGGGNAITVTKTSDYKLRIRYTLTVSLTPVALTPHSFTITGIGLITGDVMLVGGPNADGFNGGKDFATFASTASGAGIATSTGTTAGFKAAADPGAFDGAYTSGFGGNTGSNRISSYSYGAYTPGAYQRTLESITFATDRANIEIRALTIGRGVGTANTNNPGFVFAIDPDDYFTKDSLHTLTIDDLLTVSWGRA